MAVAELEEVPWLVAEDMCLEQLDGPDDTHCLEGWQDTIDPGNKHGILRALEKACRKRDPGCDYVTEYNDAHTVTENASLWNQAMRSLRYHKATGWMVK